MMHSADVRDLLGPLTGYLYLATASFERALDETESILEVAGREFGRCDWADETMALSTALSLAWKRMRNKTASARGADRRALPPALAALRALPPKLRDVLIFHDLIGLTVAETAEITGLHATDIRAMLKRGRDRAQLFLAQATGGSSSRESAPISRARLARNLEIPRLPPLFVELAEQAWLRGVRHGDAMPDSGATPAPKRRQAPRSDRGGDAPALSWRVDIVPVTPYESAVDESAAPWHRQPSPEKARPAPSRLLPGLAAAAILFAVAFATGTMVVGPARSAASVPASATEEVARLPADIAQGAGNALRDGGVAEQGGERIELKEGTDSLSARLETHASSGTAPVAANAPSEPVASALREPKPEPTPAADATPSSRPTVARQPNAQSPEPLPEFPETRPPTLADFRSPTNPAVLPESILPPAARDPRLVPRSLGPGRGYAFLGLENIERYETPHFRIYFSVSGATARMNALSVGRVAEMRLEESFRLLPRLRAIFEQGCLNADLPRDKDGQPVFTVRPPRRIKAATSRSSHASTENEPLKMNLVLTDNMEEYMRAAGLVYTRNPRAGKPDHEQYHFGVRYRSASYSSPNHLTLLYYVPGNVRWNSPLHSLGISLMILHQGIPFGEDRPMWLMLGYGYYLDFFLFECTESHWKSPKRYSDYEHDGQQEAVHETLYMHRPWAPALKRLTRIGRAATLNDLFAARWDCDDVTPETIGFMYALQAYFAGDPARAEQFARVLLQARENRETRPEKHLAQAFGHANLDALQDAWRKYILSGRFP